MASYKIGPGGGHFCQKHHPRLLIEDILISCLLVCFPYFKQPSIIAHPGAVTLLLKYGARVDIQNADGSTSLHVAVANGVPLEIVHSLVKVGTALGKKDNKGNDVIIYKF